MRKIMYFVHQSLDGFIEGPNGLLDEYHVIVHPVVLGGGKPVHHPADRRTLRLVETRSFDNRTVLLRHDQF